MAQYKLTNGKNVEVLEGTLFDNEDSARTLAFYDKVHCDFHFSEFADYEDYVSTMWYVLWWRSDDCDEWQPIDKWFYDDEPENDVLPEIDKRILAYRDAMESE